MFQDPAHMKWVLVKSSADPGRCVAGRPGETSQSPPRHSRFFHRTPESGNCGGHEGQPKLELKPVITVVRGPGVPRAHCAVAGVAGAEIR